MGRVSRRAASTSSRSPHGERGLKFRPDRGRSGRIRRSPHGERGLKFSGCGDFAWRMLSLSSRRAWIEIFPVLFSDPSVRSLSSRRAWIEMARSPTIRCRFSCRSPHGERGLKYWQGEQWQERTLSLSSRRAWIEIGR